MTSTNVKVDYLKPWAIFFVLSFIGGTVAGAIIGGVAGGVLGVLGASRGLISTLAGGLGFLVGLPISYFCFRFAVGKFLVPQISAPSAENNVEPLKAAA
jgi:hypothetical protein